MTSVPKVTISIPLSMLERLARYRPDHMQLWKRLMAGEPLSSTETAHLLLLEATYYLNSAMHGTALKLAQHALEIGRECGDRALISDALATTSYTHNWLGNFDKARTAAREALAADPEGFGAIRALTSLALCGLYTNEFDEALQRFQQALALSRALNDDYGAIRVLHNLGLLYRDRGEFELFLASMREALELDRPYGAAQWSKPMGSMQLALMQGDRAAARQALEDYWQLTPQGPRVDAAIEILRGMLLADEEDFEAAEGILLRNLSLVESTGNSYGIHLARAAISRLRRQQGEYAAAADWARSALANALRGNSRVWEVEARMELARAQWSLGDAQETESQLLTALDIAIPLGAKYWAALAAFLLSAFHFQQQRPSAAGLWLDAARRIRQGGYAFIYERERELAFPMLAQFTRSPNAETRSAAEQALAQLARIPPLPLHVKGLGAFEVRQGRRLIAERDWSKRKAGELFRFLLLQPQRATVRDAILEALWPEHTADSGRALLHQTTSTLRKILEPDLPDKFPSRYLRVEDEQIALRLPSGSTVDFEAFEQDAEARLDLYHDDLFPADRYADWAAERRERLLELYLRGLLAQAQRQLPDGNAQAALDTCVKILKRDTWREDAVELGMKACLALNDRPGALRLYLNLERTLRDELQITPRPELQEFARTLRF